MKTRFCPSPTGLMHLGNARTALFNALLALAEEGAFLLRIEDTDKTRSKDEYTEAVKGDLLWMGLQWTEGPDREGDLGPYAQSQRQHLYDQFYEILLEKGHAYHCFCTEAQLAMVRKVQRASSKPPRYPGTCRHLSAQEVQQRLEAGEAATLRFMVPAGEAIEFEDIVRGHQKFLTDDIGDFIIRRTDGTPPFMFCNAVDDAMMEVSHALRGEDHLTNTPRQIMMLNALKLPIPTYGHINLILGKDGAPLSKRNGSRSIDDLRGEGYLSSAIINYLARLGHHGLQDQFYSLAELAGQFSCQQLTRAPARFDHEQLLRWQRLAVQHTDLLTLWQWMGAQVHGVVPIEQRDAFVAAVQPNIIFPKDALVWADVIYADIALNADEQKILQQAGADFFTKASDLLVDNGADFKALTKELKSACNVKGKQLFLPLRIAFTGFGHGPEMVQLLPLMGVERARERLLRAGKLAEG